MNAQPQKVVVYTPSGRAMDGFVARVVWQTPDGQRFPTKRAAVQHMKRSD